MILANALALGVVRRGGGASYDPIAALGDDLLGWWEAGQGMTLVGSAVSEWIDKKSGSTITQSVGSARPIYSATSFNGSPGLTFDGVDDNLSADSIFSFPSGSAASEVWGVVQQDAAASDASIRMVLCYGGAASTDRRSINRVVDTGVNRARVAVGNGGGSPGVTGTVVDFSSRHLVRSVVGTSTSRMDVDGNLSGTVSVTPATSTTQLRIGANTNASPGAFWNGKVRDIIVTTALSSEKAAALETYLLARRAL